MKSILGEFFIKSRIGLGIKWIVRGIVGSIPPMFVKPEPAFGAFADHCFDGRPAALDVFGFGKGVFEHDLGQGADFITSVGERKAKNREEPRLGHFGQGMMDGDAPFFESEIVGDGAGLIEFEGEIDKKTAGAPAFESFEKAEDGAFLGDEGESEMRAGTVEIGSDRGVFNVLPHHDGIHPDGSPEEGKPFEITQVSGEKNAALTGRKREVEIFASMNVEKAEEFCGGKAGCPEKVEKRSGQIAKRIAGDAIFFSGQIVVSEDDIEIGEGDPATAMIQLKDDIPSETSHGKQVLARKPGDNPDEQIQPDDFEAVSNFLPNTAHVSHSFA